jgi:hypothetical protein
VRNCLYLLQIGRTLLEWERRRVTYRGVVALDPDGNPSLLGLLLHLVVGSLPAGARALACLARPARIGFAGNLCRVLIGAAAVGAQVQHGPCCRRLLVVRGRPGEAEPEGELAVSGGAGRRQRPRVALAARATAGGSRAEAQRDEVLIGVIRDVTLRRWCCWFRGKRFLLVGCLFAHLDDVEEVHLQRLVVADDVGEKRLEALVLLLHLAHLRLKPVAVFLCTYQQYMHKPGENYGVLIVDA